MRHPHKRTDHLIDYDKYARWLRGARLWPHKRRIQAVAALLQEESERAATLLIQVILEDVAPASAEIVQEVVRWATSGPLVPEATVARELLCQLALFHGHAFALDVTLDKGYVPRQLHQRVVFYFLTQQWAKYEALDLDGQLLRAAYAEADIPLRGRISTLGRQTGRVDWMVSATESKPGRRLDTLTETEWQTVQSTLFERRRYADLWHLAQVAPPLWSIRIVRRLHQVGWRPAVPHTDDFDAITASAARCGDDFPDFSPAILRTHMLDAHQGKILDVAVLPASEGPARCVSCGSDGVLRMWSLLDGQLLATSESNGWPVRQVLAVGDWVISGHTNGDVNMWRADNLRHLWHPHPHMAPITVLRRAPDEQHIVIGCEDGYLYMAGPLPYLHQVLAIEKSDRAAVVDLVASQNGEWFAYRKGYGGGLVRLCPWGASADGAYKVHTSDDSGMAFSADGRWFATSARLTKAGPAVTWDFGAIDLWSLSPSVTLHRTLREHKESVLALAFTPDGKTLISGGKDNQVHTWDMTTLQHRHYLVEHPDAVTRLTLDTSGHLLVTSGKHPAAFLWSLPDDALLCDLSGNSHIHRVVFSPHTRQLIVADADGQLALWDIAPALLRERPLNHLSFADIDWLADLAQHPTLSAVAQAWAAFANAMLLWRHRFDIEVADALSVIGVGEFDIELEG